MRPITAADLVRLLRELEHSVSQDELPVLRITPSDPVDWASFPPHPTCRVPGIPVGQAADVRFSIANSEQGLHIQPFAQGHVDAHLDRKDACHRTVAHLVQDTRMIEGAAFGALIGLVAGALIGNGGVAAGLIAVGGGLGAAAGANTARRRSIVFSLRDLVGAPR